jgi:hypothetical protein
MGQARHRTEAAATAAAAAAVVCCGGPSARQSPLGPQLPSCWHSGLELQLVYDSRTSNSGLHLQLVHHGSLLTSLTRSTSCWWRPQWLILPIPGKEVQGMWVQHADSGHAEPTFPVPPSIHQVHIKIVTSRFIAVPTWQWVVTTQVHKEHHQTNLRAGTPGVWGTCGLNAGQHILNQRI